MKVFKWEGKYVVWAEMSEIHIAHVEADNVKEAEEKARQLPKESWELVDGHGDIRIDEAVPLAEDEMWSNDRFAEDKLQEEWDSKVAKERRKYDQGR